jgi:hypothetical protein
MTFVTGVCHLIHACPRIVVAPDSHFSTTKLIASPARVEDERRMRAGLQKPGTVLPSRVMLDLRTVIEWSHALQEQHRRLRAESGRLEADYKWLAFQFEQFKKLLPQSKPDNGITNS